MLTPLEAGLQPDPCLFIKEEEGPGGLKMERYNGDRTARSWLTKNNQSKNYKKNTTAEVFVYLCLDCCPLLIGSVFHRVFL